MQARESKKLQKIRREWVGQRIAYYLLDVLDKKSHGGKLDGPYYGTVTGATDNSAAIEDRLEGYDHRNSADFTGCLIVLPDDKITEDFPILNHCKKIDGNRPRREHAGAM